MTLPTHIRAWLLDHVTRERLVAALLIDAGGLLIDWFGPVGYYGLGDLERGRPIVERCVWLAGVLPIGDTPLHLPRMSADPAQHFDAHLLPDGPRTWVVLLDASQMARHQQAAQQVSHELARLRRDADTGGDEDQKHWLEEIVRALGLAAISHEPDGRYRVREPIPSWFATAFPGHIRGGTPGEPDTSDFLGNFIADAEEFWASNNTGPLRSGEWIESGPDGQELRCDATALRLGHGGAAILVQALHETDERRQILQAARENGLQLRHLLKEIERKEVLLHCIVHDLGGPLTSIQGALEMLGHVDLSAATSRRLLGIGLRQARALETQIRQILGVFRAELEALEAFSVDPEFAPDVLASIRELTEAMDAAFATRHTALVVHPPEDATGSWRVVGQAGRLERVLSNLLENALRHAPPGSAVEASLTRSASAIVVTIADRGPGVPDTLREKLFEKFSQGLHSGKGGLGLYFCHMTLKRWGGAIAYEPREDGGARFMLTLRRALRS